MSTRNLFGIAVEDDGSYDRLCAILTTGSSIPPALLCDPLLTVASGRISLHPELLDRWLEKHCGWDGHASDGTEESTAEFLTRRFGAEAARLAKKCI